ncbi:hypothetical protein HYX03_01050 [Candidatus Woesearchaeota archaeon]|nr:hypothetical protein [Candidatus Woesearchaeota archaeon]
MKYAHLIKLTVFSYEHENIDSVLDSFLRLFPFILEDSKVVLNKTNATGFNEKKITVFEVALTKSNLINLFLRNLLNNLDENQKNQILQQADSRIDKNLDFFIRFDKDSWIKEKRLMLTDSGRCFHVKISIAAFPKKREVALSVVRDMLKNA